MVSDQIWWTIGEIIAFFMAGYATYGFYYYDPSLMNGLSIIMFVFMGVVFAARSVELF